MSAEEEKKRKEKRKKEEEKKKKRKGKKERKNIRKSDTWPREFWEMLDRSLQQGNNHASPSSAWPSRRGWGKFLHILDTESEPHACLLREKELFWSGFWSSGCLQRLFRWCTSRSFQIGDTPGESSGCGCKAHKFHKTRPFSANESNWFLEIFEFNSFPNIPMSFFKSPVREIDSQIW